MTKWTVEKAIPPDINPSTQWRGWYVKRSDRDPRSSAAWLSADEGWTEDDAKILADRRNAREKPGFTVEHTSNGVWSVGTLADFYGIDAEQHAEDFANKLNKEHGQ